MRAILLALVALSSVILCQACINRQEIQASVWLNNAPLPAEMCGPKPTQPDPHHVTLWDYGFYRRLNSGKFEFISFCDQDAAKWVAVYQDDFNKILDGLLPKSN